MGVRSPVVGWVFSTGGKVVAVFPRGYPTPTEDIVDNAMFFMEVGKRLGCRPGVAGKSGVELTYLGPAGDNGLSMFAYSLAPGMTYEKFCAHIEELKRRYGR